MIITAKPTIEEISSEKDLIRKAILNAMLRIIEGRPLHATVGAFTAKALAAEAQIDRSVLYQKHPDLKDRFIYLRDHLHEPSRAEVAVTDKLNSARDQIEHLERRVRETTAERDDWKRAAESLARALNVREREIAQRDRELGRLRDKLAKMPDSHDELAARRQP